MPTPPTNFSPPLNEKPVLPGLVILSLALFNLAVDYDAPYGSPVNFILALLTLPLACALLLTCIQL